MLLTHSKLFVYHSSFYSDKDMITESEKNTFYMAFLYVNVIYIILKVVALRIYILRIL